MALLDLVIQHPVIAVAAGVLIALVVSSARSRSIRDYPDLPWVGKKSNAIGAATYANFISPVHTREWLTEGYNKYTKHGRSFLMPSMTGKPQIIVPNDRLQMYNDMPEDVLSAWKAHYDSLACKYSFTDPDLVKIRFHEHVLTTYMPRKLNDILPTSVDELSVTMDEIFGHDTENWKEVKVLPMMTKIACRVSNRTLIGLPLCRDQKLLDTMISFAEDAIRCYIWNSLIPTLFEPLMNIIAIPNWIHYLAARKALKPVIEQRLLDIQEKDSNPKSTLEIPDDYITWHIRTARAEGKPWALDISWTVRCLLALEFATIHTTLITGSNAILDVFSSPSSVQESLREEAERVYSQHNQTWSKQSLNKLVRSDSALRESMRIGNFSSFTARKVVAKEGMYDPIEGFTAPVDSTIAILSWNRHHDPEVYNNPDEFDAFRFSRPREAYMYSEEEDREQWLKLQNLSMTSVGKDNLAFGMGRHSCPGRFFAQQELKLLLSYLVMYYEVEQLKERPENVGVGGSGMAPRDSMIRVRKRKSAV